MIDYDFWFMFILAGIILNATPGPDLLFIITKTVSGGKKIGFASSLGVCTGALFHVFFAAVGLSAILATSAVAFSIVKYLGVIYLFYLVYQSFVNSKIDFDIDVKQKDENFFKVFRQGVLIDILNPKVAIFFMAFLPQFIREGYGSIEFQFVYLGIITIVIALIIEAVYIVFASKISQKIYKNKKYTLWMNKIVGTIFLALGVKLFYETN